MAKSSEPKQSSDTHPPQTDTGAAAAAVPPMVCVRVPTTKEVVCGIPVLVAPKDPSGTSETSE